MNPDPIRGPYREQRLARIEGIRRLDSSLARASGRHQVAYAQSALDMWAQVDILFADSISPFGGRRPGGALPVRDGLV